MKKSCLIAGQILLGKFNLSTKLKLLAYEEEDFKVLSSILQDSAMPTTEMNYNKSTKEFVIISSRFDWEKKIIQKNSSRVLCGLCFSNVERVSKRNFPNLKTENILNFLTLIPRIGYINILFSGDIELKLYGTKIFLRLDDLNKEWPTIFIPNHK